MGPLLYGIVHVLATVIFWTASPSGVAALAVLCFGDGAAELVGRSWGRQVLFYNPRKVCRPQMGKGLRRDANK